MRPSPSNGNSPGLLSVLLLLSAMPLGCREAKPTADKSANDEHAVQVVSPEKRTIARTVVQPGFVEAYEQTSIFSKVSGFIRRFYVDIGQEVKKDELLAEIFVPELAEEYQRKQAQVQLEKVQVEQARQMVVVAENNLQTAVALLAEAKANVGKYEAEVVRWASEVKRLTAMLQDKVIDKQVLAESQRQLDSSKASRDAAVANVAAKEAARATSEATLGKAKIDVKTQQAKVDVAEADERKAAALLGYTRITAPYDGVVTVRNANTGDYVQAVTGDKSTPNPSPIFVVARTDLLRIFVGVPEKYARYVKKGTEAAIRTETSGGMLVRAPIIRTSWSLSQRTRTLRAEVDLPAKEYGELRPGSYVYGEIVIRRPSVYTLPQQTLVVAGNDTYCYRLQSGKAVKTQAETGLSDGTWTEIVGMNIDGVWKDVAADCRVISGDLTDLVDGQAVADEAESLHLRRLR